MDPLTLSTAFATIVSLLGSYSSERGSERASSYEDFMSWLVEKNHQELVGIIEQNHTTVVSVKALLSQNHEVVASHLRSLDESMAQIASGIAEFRGLALLAHPQHELSYQAISLLSEFCDSGASKMLEMHVAIGALYSFVDTNLSFVPSEPRFIQDDLNALVSLGLLNLEYASDKRRDFQITRNAVRYVEAIRKMATR
jgi:hypothetical protein